MGKGWLCSAEGCGEEFCKWDHLYKHLQSHSKPLACPVCHYRTDRPKRLASHRKKAGHEETITVSVLQYALGRHNAEGKGYGNCLA